MTRKLPAHLVVLWLALLAGCPCYAQGKFSQAVPISGSQFFGSLKAVSLDLRSDPSLAKYVPLAEQQSEIIKALAGYGISVRPNMQVTLVVTAIHHAPVMSSNIIGTGAVADSTVVHGIYILTEFFLKAAALRNGGLHPVMATPVLGWSASIGAENTNTRKLLLGDDTAQNIRSRFIRVFGECLQHITKDTTPQETPWFVDSWTEKARAGADADYLKLMNPGVAVDKNPFEGLSSAPQISLDPRFNANDCKAYPGWNDAWARVFQRLRWTGSAPPRVALTHRFDCTRGLGLITDLGYSSAQDEYYFPLFDLIYLLQSDLVFELNGKPVRTWGVIYSTHHETLALENTVHEQMEEFIPRNIQDFLTDVALGNGPDTTPVSLGTQSSSGEPAQGPATTKPPPSPSAAPRSRPAPIMVGKADVTHLAGLSWGDTREYVASIFGSPTSDFAQDSNAFGGYPHTRSDGLSIRVNYYNNVVTSMKVYSRGSGVGADSILDLLGKSESAAIALLGPPGTREQGYTNDKMDLVWSFPEKGRPAQPSPEPEGTQTLTLHFKTGMGCESIDVQW